MTLVALMFFGLILTGLPIGYVLGIAGVTGLLQIGGHNFLTMAPKRFFEGLDLFTFMAMPFFILAGEIMNRSGITERLADFANALVGYLRGGLAHSNMVASVMFAGMTGAAVSDTAAFGNTLVPAMVKEGYTRPFSCAVTVAGSIIGPTIPPSNLMVIYGSLMGVSIAGLFAAGILPGLLICLLCMAVIAALGRRLNLPKSERGPSLRRIVTAFRSSFLALLMPAIILGGILLGIVTPTEAAAIAVFYALFIGVLDIPFAFPNISTTYAVFDGPFGRKLAADIEKKTGLKVLGFGDSGGFFQFTNSKRPIKSPADMQGLKIRTMGLDTHKTIIRALGGQPAAIAWSEVYTALQTGVADGEMNPIPIIAFAKFNEVQKYLTLSGHLFAPYIWVMNRKFWDGLSDSEKYVVKYAARSAIVAGRGMGRIIEASSRGLPALAKDMQVNSLSPEQKAKFRDKALPAVKALINKKFGAQGNDMLKAFLDAIAAAEK